MSDMQYERDPIWSAFQWTQMVTIPRVPHPDPVVEALFSQAWSGDELLNAYDDAERIVEIVRQAMSAATTPAAT